MIVHFSNDSGTFTVFDVGILLFRAGRAVLNDQISVEHRGEYWLVYDVIEGGLFYYKQMQVFPDEMLEPLEHVPKVANETFCCHEG